MWQQMAAQAAGKAAEALKAGPAGPSSAYGKSDSAQRGVMDGSNWSVNYGGAQLAGGGMQWVLLAGVAVLAVVWLKKR